MKVREFIKLEKNLRSLLFFNETIYTMNLPDANGFRQFDQTYTNLKNLK